jgi:hypothetical protein
VSEPPGDAQGGEHDRCNGDDSLIHAEPRFPDETVRPANFLSLDTNPSSESVG